MFCIIYIFFLSFCKNIFFLLRKEIGGGGGRSETREGWGRTKSGAGNRTTERREEWGQQVYGSGDGDGGGGVGSKKKSCIFKKCLKSISLSVFLEGI